MTQTTSATAPTGKVRAQTVRNLRALTPAARDALFEAVFDVQRRIFDGVDAPTLRRYTIDPPGDAATLTVYRMGEEVVGYLALHQVRCRVAGQRAVVIRGAAGVLPRLRGTNLIGAAVARMITGCWLRHPRHRIYAFATPVSPAMYAAAYRGLAECWPRPDAPTPPATAAIMQALAERFALAPEVPGRPGVRAVGWRVREPGRCDRADPAVRFYLDHNPDFAEGYGLTLLVPLHRRNIAHGLRRVVRKRLRWLSGRRARRPLAG